MARRTKTGNASEPLREELTVRRLRARLEAQSLRGALKAQKAMLSTYAAADRGRKNKDWRAPGTSATQIVVEDSATLNARARQMVRDNWAAKSAIRAFARNVIGCGIIPIPQARDDAGKLDDAFNRQLMLDFWLWAGDKDACDIERRQTLWQKQWLGESERATVGEMFLIWDYRAPLKPSGQIDMSRPVGLRIQSFEPEQLDTTITAYMGNRVAGGVEIDADGAAVAYHVFPGNPNDYLLSQQRKSVRVPTQMVFHCFRQERVGQVRGVTELTAVLQDLRDLARYKDANLWRAIMEACIGMVIRQPAPSSTSGVGLGIGPRQPGDTGTTPSGMPTFDMVPGMVARLGEGEDITPIIPQAPGNGYEPFTRQTLRGAAAGTGISYGQISRDFTQGTYSGQRQEMLEDRKEFEPLHELHAHNWILPLFRLWVGLYVAEGRVDDSRAVAFAENPSRFYGADYVAPPATWIDPEKEANAIEKMIRLGLMTREEAAHMRGMRLTDILDKIAAERKEAQSRGIALIEQSDDVQIAFQRNVIDAMVRKDSTSADVIANSTDVGALLKSAGIPTRPDYQQPWIPVVAQAGPLVSGDTIKDEDGNVVGGDVVAPTLPPVQPVIPPSETPKPEPAAKLAVVQPAAPFEVPDYRPAVAGEPPRCELCRFFVNGKCTAYDFVPDPQYVCDAFETVPLAERAEIQGRPVIGGPGVPEGERPMDDPRSSFLDEATRGVLAEKAGLDWVTINGVHVLIGDDGTITEGPKGFVGKKPSEIGNSESQGAADHASDAPKQDQPKAQRMTPDEARVVRWWVTGGTPMQEIREYHTHPSDFWGLRAEQVADRAKTLKRALDKTPTFQGVVYRGVEGSRIRSVKPGATIRMETFHSTSKKPETAAFFASAKERPTVLELKLNGKGSHDLTSLRVGRSAKEQEVVLDKGTSFKVIEAGTRKIGKEEVSYVRAEQQ